MAQAKADIIAQLQKEILGLQGLKKTNDRAVDFGWGSIDAAFPDKCFPTAAVHEFVSTCPEDKAASTGFISGILGTLMKNTGSCVWISTTRTIFPPALKHFGIEPHNIIFIDLQRERDVLWATEEALKCEGLGAVVGEISDLNFNASRRLQLAVEQSRVTGFVLRHQPGPINITACVTRWKITSLPGKLPDDMPGLGFPCWQVDLQKVRNGKPGSWQVEWVSGKFRNNQGYVTSLKPAQQKKAI